MSIMDDLELLVTSYMSTCERILYVLNEDKAAALVELGSLINNMLQLRDIAAAYEVELPEFDFDQPLAEYINSKQMELDV